MPTLYRCERKTIQPKKENHKKEHGSKKKNLPPPKKKLSFKTCKKNTIDSLHQVEFFLRDFKKFSNYIKLYKILK